jgi:antitoxin component YwqK of YwqJK toxin-antitoxin module
MDNYFTNTDLLQNTLLPYFCVEEPMKFVNKMFYKLNYEKYNTHLQPHGIIEMYYKDIKTIQEKYNYKNGKLHGLQEEWGGNGQLTVRGNCKNGKLEGLYEFWSQNGQIKRRVNYKNNLFNGLYEVWHDNGQLYIKTNYKNGELDGLFEEWSYNGKLIKNNNYRYRMDTDILNILIFSFISIIIMVSLAVGNIVYLKYF